MSSNDFNSVANQLNSSISSIVDSGGTRTNLDSVSYIESFTPEELQYIKSQIAQLQQQQEQHLEGQQHAFSTNDIHTSQHMDHGSGNDSAGASVNINEPLYVSTGIPTRLSSSDEKMYSPKHISAGEKLYSPKPSQTSSKSHTEKRKVDIEPCGTFRDLMLSDLPPIPDVPVKMETQEKEKHAQQEDVDAPSSTKENETSKDAQEVSASEKSSEDTKEDVEKDDDASATTPELRTWREAIKSRCAVVKPKAETRCFDEILKPVMQTDDYNQLMEKVTGKYYFRFLKIE